MQIIGWVTSKRFNVDTPHQECGRVVMHCVQLYLCSCVVQRVLFFPSSPTPLPPIPQSVQQVIPRCDSTMFARCADISPPDISPPDIHPPDIRPPDIRPPDIRPPDIRPPDIRPPDISPPDISPPMLICMICPYKECD